MFHSNVNSSIQSISIYSVSSPLSTIHYPLYSAQFSFPLVFPFTFILYKNVPQKIFNSVLLAQLLSWVPFLHLCVTIYCYCSLHFHVSLYFNCMSFSSSLCWGASMFSPPLLTPLNFKVPNLNHTIQFQWHISPSTMYIHFSSLTPLYVSKHFFAPIFSAFDCLCTSLHLIYVIWHSSLNSLPFLLNQIHSSPVLCTSSLQALLPKLSISDFLSSTHNNILTADCSSDSESGVVISTIFCPTKTAPTICDYTFIFLNKVYFKMVLYLYLHLHLRCNDLHPCFTIQVWDSRSAWQWRLMLWSAGLWHLVAWYMNIDIISTALLQCSGQKCFLKTHYSENTSNCSHLRSVTSLGQTTTVRVSNVV
jgi:hypothetical protein